ncbi:hypothetical protein AURDEDRAFT_159913 [Auricularia subglabra TFB-10046 SS5]|nr:hypothetical protein AURDEDRAFT_159913 [Auricularia subglabra TFB-10046 SS5]
MSLDPASLDPAQLAQIGAAFEQAIYAVLVWKRYFLAGMTLLCFDWIISFNLEVERIWKSTSWSVKIIWVGIRYCPLITGPLIGVYVFDADSRLKTCRRYASFPSAVILVYIIITHAAFMMRTYALYGRDRRVVVGLAVLLLVEIAIFAWGLSTEVYAGGAEPLALLPGCYPAVIVGDSGIGVWVMAFGFDVIIMVLTIGKSISYLLQHEKSNVLNVLVRDGVAYFAVIFAFYIINLIYYLTGSDLWRLLHTTFGALLGTILTSRLILNLRGVASSRIPEPLETTPNVARTNGPQGAAFTAYESVMEDFMSAFLQARDEEEYGLRGTRVALTKDDEVETLDG